MWRYLVYTPALLLKAGLPARSKRRTMPDFLIIGASRYGTTSVYNYLRRHPCIAPAARKEIHFFDNHFHKSVAWYRAQFPPLYFQHILRKVLKRDFLTGESTPYYLFHPHAAHRISQLIPSAKLIVLLRNPVDRAYSDYQNKVARGLETLTFEQALDQEQKRLQGEVQKMIKDEDYYSFNHHRFAYVAKGIYVDQLMRWLSYFPREQLLILRSEDLYEHARRITKEIVDFLELPCWEPTDRTIYNYRQYSPMDGVTHRRLTTFYAPHNKRLYDQLGIEIRRE